MELFLCLKYFSFLYLREIYFRLNVLITSCFGTFFSHWKWFFLTGGVLCLFLKYGGTCTHSSSSHPTVLLETVRDCLSKGALRFCSTSTELYSELYLHTQIQRTQKRNVVCPRGLLNPSRPTPASSPQWRCHGQSRRGVSTKVSRLH